MTEPAPANASLRDRLNGYLPQATKAEQAIATYFLANLNDLPFETAASLARKIGVSELTVGRFCRAIGYQRLKDLKADLRDDLGGRHWLIADRLREFQTRSQSKDDYLAQNLQLEIASLVRVYEIAQSPEFQNVVRRLAHMPKVYVGGFQTERGIAALLAHQLQYLRDNVQLIDLSSGSFAEILLAPPRETCLVLVDSRRYSMPTKLLAEKAHDAGIPVTLIADPYCSWAAGRVSEVFAVPTEMNFVWESMAQMASLVNLLINGVFNEIGPAVEERMNKVAALYSSFIGYVDDPAKR
jgi:DNA-binding MurR/RpiR family transcriptional regulator